jgi:hypothetical protein
MKLGMVMDKEERNLLEGHVQGQSQLSRSKTLNFNKQRMDSYFLMKFSTVIEINKRHLSARSH